MNKRLHFWMALFFAMIFFACKREANIGFSGENFPGLVGLRSGNSSLFVDANFALSLVYNQDTLTNNQGGERSVSLMAITPEGERICFQPRFYNQKRVRSDYEEVEWLAVSAFNESGDIESQLDIRVFASLPETYFVKHSIINTSADTLFMPELVSCNLYLRPDSGLLDWYSFQGAGYEWGQDFAFDLSADFERENFFGLNTEKSGGGIPFTDVWNANYGVAIASAGDHPEAISIPVKSDSLGILMGRRQVLKPGYLLPGDSLITTEMLILVHSGDFFDPLRKYSDVLSVSFPLTRKPLDFKHTPEWCTWGYGPDFNPDQVIDSLDRLKELGFKTIIIDDGWAKRHGDWVPDPEKFPRGEADFKLFIEKIHQKGFKVWLWWVPAYAVTASEASQEHPDWFILDEAGRRTGDRLCMDYTPVLQHHKKLLEVFIRNYHIDGLKLDFEVMNAAPDCYNPVHKHKEPNASFVMTPAFFKELNDYALSEKPDFVMEYCPCGIPPTVFHLAWTNLAVTSDPDISQITTRVKMYKALRGSDFPVLEEWCGVLAGPGYALAIGAGAIPGTFSTKLDGYHQKWLEIYKSYSLSEGEYVNLYDIAFDYPEGHLIRKDDKLYYAFFTHPWNQLKNERLYRYGKVSDAGTDMKDELDFPVERYSGTVELKGLDVNRRYRVIDYVNRNPYPPVKGENPFLELDFENFILLEVSIDH